MLHKIIDIDPVDFYYKHKDQLIGQTGTLNYVYHADDGWVSCHFTLTNPVVLFPAVPEQSTKDFMFAKIRLDTVDTSTTLKIFTDEKGRQFIVEKEEIKKPKQRHGLEYALGFEIEAQANGGKLSSIVNNVPTNMPDGTYDGIWVGWRVVFSGPDGVSCEGRSIYGVNRKVPAKIFVTRKIYPGQMVVSVTTESSDPFVYMEKR